MNEETNISAIPEDTAPETESTSAMEDDWDDIDLSDIQDDEEEREETPAESEEQTPEADQQTEEAEEKAEEEPAEADNDTAQESVEEQQTFDLKFLGETKTVSKEEVVTLAQKGLNYDKVLGERDVAKQEVSRLQEYETFLKDLADMDGRTVDDLMDATRAEILAKKEGLDKSVALQRIKLDRDRKAFEAEKSKKEAEQKATEEAEKQRSNQFLQFAQEYPDVDPKDIPKEVWDKFRDGMPLTSAYSIYENKKLREEVKSWKDKAEAAEQNAKNKERSTGSQSTAGMGSAKKKDPIDLDWYDGT